MTKPTMKKPTVGQTLYSLNIGNAARNTKQELTAVVVTGVGRKYFSVKNIDPRWRHVMQFHLFSWREKSNYSPNARLYETEQEWLDEKEGRELSKGISTAFEHGRNKTGISLSRLRQIMRILEDGQ